MTEQWARDLEETMAADAMEPEEPSADKLGELGALAEELVDLRAQIAQAEAALAALNKQEQELSGRRIPDLLQELRLKGITTATGKKLSVKDGLSGSLPKDPQKRAWALNYLRENGAESLIKHEVQATFGKGEEHAAQALVKLLHERGDRFSDQTSVHPQTLAAWGREQTTAGKSLPLESLGLYQWKKTELK